MKAIHLAALFCLLAVASSGAEHVLRDRTISIQAPEGAVLLSAEDTAKRFHKGRPPHVAYDIPGSGCTITLKESVTFDREVSLGQVGESILDLQKKSVRDFSLIASGTVSVGDRTFFEMIYSDTSDNDLKMKRRMRIYLHERTALIVGSSIPIHLVERYEARIVSSMDSFAIMEEKKS